MGRVLTILTLYTTRVTLGRVLTILTLYKDKEDTGEGTYNTHIIQGPVSLFLLCMYNFIGISI